MNGPIRPDPVLQSSATEFFSEYRQSWHRRCTGSVWTVASSPDGDCLYNSLQLALFGTEAGADILRLRVHLEIVAEVHRYSFDASAENNKLTMFGTYGTQPDLKEIRNLLDSSAIVGHPQSIHAVAACSAVVKRPIAVYYPRNKTQNSISNAHCSFTNPPHVQMLTGPAIGIAWTSTMNQQVATFHPNHFVPILPYGSQGQSALPLPAPFFSMTEAEEKIFVSAIQMDAEPSRQEHAMNALQQPESAAEQLPASPMTVPLRRPKTTRTRKRSHAPGEAPDLPSKSRPSLSCTPASNNKAHTEARQAKLDRWLMRPDLKVVSSSTSEKAPKKQRTLHECYAAAQQKHIGSNMAAPGSAQASQGYEDFDEGAATPTECLPPDTLPISFLTWNVMGLTTIKEELTQMIEEKAPDVIVLTKTKLTERTQGKGWLRSVLRDYWLHFSSRVHKTQQVLEHAREGSGGLAVAVKKTLMPQGCITKLNNIEAHRGHLVQLCMQPPKSAPIMVQGVYMPFDQEHRLSIYQAIQGAYKKPQHNIVLGDFNAALYPTDRTSQQWHPIDQQHKDSLAECGLRPTDRTVRPYTFSAHSLADNVANPSLTQSRIDDILISSHICDPASTEVLHATDDSDHLPITAQIDLGAIGFIPVEHDASVPQLCNHPRFTMPTKKDQLLMYQSKLHLAQAQQIFALKRKIESSIAILDGLSAFQGTTNTISGHNDMHARRLKAAEAHGLHTQVEALALEMEGIWQAARGW